MSVTSTATSWPFAIVESRLIVAPDFLVRRGETDARIRRLLINRTRIDQARGQAVHRSVLTVPGGGRFALAYRYVPVPGDARDEATRPLHMAQGIVCDSLRADITDETLDRARGQLLTPLKRYVTHGWSGPPAASHGEPLSELPRAGEPTPNPLNLRRGRDLARSAVLIALLAATGGLLILTLIIRRFLT